MILPDCVRCGGQVVTDVDHDGPVEACTRCGLAQTPPPALERGEVRELVRQTRRKRRLLAPKCFGRLHHQCRVKTCECRCHKEREVPA